MTTTPTEPEAVEVPSVEDVATAVDKPVEKIRGVYAAEVSDQWARCRVEPYNAALSAALVRRVRRALDMQALPLGVMSDGEFGSVRIGSTDPEVRRLEAPYRRLVCG